MIQYGKGSRARIAELAGPLQEILMEYAAQAPPELDLSIVAGFRGEAAQNAALASGASNKAWGESKHNMRPARAFDFTVWPDLSESASPMDVGIAYGKRIGLLLSIAARRKIPLRVGIDWRKPFDPGHVELAV